MELTSSDAILLIAHGSRRAQANHDLEILADMVRKRVGETTVEIAYLELAEPSIPQGANACVRAGANRVFMLPFFLSAGRHVAKDLEDFKQTFTRDYPHVQFAVSPPLGLHPMIVEILLARLHETELDPVSL